MGNRGAVEFKMNKNSITLRRFSTAIMACILAVALTIGLGFTASAESGTLGVQKAYASPIMKASSASKAKISKKKATLVKGKSTTVKVKKANGNKVKWKSSNTKVAKVKKIGKAKARIKAMKAGKATITAKVGRKTLKCRVTVVGKLSATKVTITPLATKQLKLNGATAKKWTSSNTSRVRVTSSGVIIPQQTGDPVTITCTDTVGNKYQCKVTVTPPNITCRIVGTYYEEPRYTKYYSKKFLFTNRTKKTIVLDEDVMLYYPYFGIGDSDTSETLLGQSGSVTALSSAPLTVYANDSVTFYGFEGTEYYSSYSDGIVAMSIKIGGKEYSCLFRGSGKLESMHLRS